jgi:arylsulfatase A-like enzyme
VFALCAMQPQPTLAEHPRARNFLFIIIDTLRSDHVGAYGSELALTPNLDALAKEAFVFETPIATSAWTRSSIASMFTSQFPSGLGVIGREDHIPENVRTVFEEFQRHGVATFGVTTNGNAGPSWGFGQGFDRFDYPDLMDAYPGDRATFPARGVTETALDWLRGRGSDAPFLMFLHYSDPHAPYLPHPGLLADPPAGGRFDGSFEQLRAMDRIARDGGLEEVDVARIRHLYAGEVKYCDLWIGKLIAGLKARGVWDDLMIVVTADHGEGLWDHGFRAHGKDLYEEMIRVPLIIRYPGTPGGRVSPPVSLIDLGPTMLAAAGLPIPAEYEGRDLWPLIAAQDAAASPLGIYSELNLDGIDLESVRLGPWKLIRDRGRPGDDGKAYEVFDLTRDPKEKSELKDGGGEHGRRLRRALDQWQAAVGRDASEQQGNPRLRDLSETDLESMRALGYLSDEEFRKLSAQGKSNEK